MAGIQPISFTTPTEYSAEEQNIARQRQIAQMLQQQSMSPIEQQPTAGGFTVPISPFQGLAKMLQAYGGMKGEQMARERETGLTQAYQQQLADTLAQYGQAKPDEQPSILMRHPITQQAGLQLMLQNAQRDRTMQAFGLGPQGQGQPQAMPQGAQQASPMPPTPGAAPAAAAGQGAMPAAPQAAGNDLVGGIPRNIAMALVLADPTGKLLAEAQAKAHAEATKPINVRPGGTVAVLGPGGKYESQFYAPKLAEGMNIGPQGVGVAQGFPQAQTALSAVPKVNAPMMTIKASNQRELSLTQPEYLQYTQSGGKVLPSRYAPLGPELPGVQFQDAGQQAAQGAPTPPAPQGPTPNNFGNIRPQGANTGFQQFPTPEAGLAAIDQNLQAYAGKGINTISGIVSRWAPPSENDTRAYIADVSKRLGVPADTPLDMKNPAVRQAIGTAIMLHEKGPQMLSAQGRGAEPAVLGATQSQGEQVTQARQTAAGKATDEQFAKDYVAFTTGGGADAAKQLGQLKDVSQALQNPQANLTGPWLGRVPDAVKAFVNPQSIAMRERVEEVVQRSLRAILGAQFTEKEGERLIARAYNPAMPEAENAIRVNRLYTQLQQAFQAKQDAAAYFQKNGTLEGWNGKLYSISDFEPNTGRNSSGQVSGAPGGGADINALVQKYAR